MKMNRKVAAALAGTAIFWTFSGIAEAQQALDAVRHSDRIPSTVAVIGTVTKPGTFVFRPVLVSAAIESAGGLAKDGDPTKIIIRRGFLINPSGSISVSYNYERVRRQQEADLALTPGDVIDVPRRRGRSFLSSLASTAKKAGNSLGTLVRPLLLAVAPSLADIARKPSVAPVPAIRGVAGVQASGSELNQQAVEALLTALLRVDGDEGQRRDKVAAAFESVLRQLAGSDHKKSDPDIRALQAALLRALATGRPDVRDRVYKEVLGLLGAADRLERMESP